MVQRYCPIRGPDNQEMNLSQSGWRLSIGGDWTTILRSLWGLNLERTMHDIERLVTDIQRGVDLALGSEPGIRTIFADPDELAKLIMAGEFRRISGEKTHDCPVPRFCILSVTWECNLTCTGCYARNYDRGSEMSLDTIRRVLGEAIDLGSYIFVIVGGEPLMVDGLIETLASLTGGLFFLFTNGTLMDESHAAALGSAPNVFPIFSTEGADEHTDERRGAGVGEKIRNAMALLKRNEIAFGVSTMVSPANLDEVTSRKWFDHIWDLGVRFAFLIDYVSCGGKPDKSLALSEDDMARKTAALDARWAEARPLAMNFPFDEYADDAPCQAGGAGMMHINADGAVEPCPFSHYAVDNVRDKSLAEILGGEFFTRIREDICTLPNPTKTCLLSQHPEKVAALASQLGGGSTEG